MELHEVLFSLVEAGKPALAPDPDIGVFRARPPSSKDKPAPSSSKGSPGPSKGPPEKGAEKGGKDKGSSGGGKWVSAGGVIIPSMKKATHVWIVKPSNNYGPWAFPKGRVDKGESLRQAAIREIEEETGLTAKIVKSASGGLIGKGKGSFSVTHFFLMVQTGGSPKKNDEMEEIRLVTWDRAKAFFKSAGNKRDGAIADAAIQTLRAMGLDTGVAAPKELDLGPDEPEGDAGKE